MKFTWYTYQVALLKSRREFTQAFDEGYPDQLYVKDSALLRKYHTMQSVLKRQHRENPKVPNALNRTLFRMVKH